MPLLKRAFVVTLATAAYAVVAFAQSSGDDVFGLARVHQVNVTVTADEWKVLQTSAARGATGAGGSDYVAPDGRLIHVGGGFRGYFPWVHADMRLGTSDFKNVGL